MQALRVLHTRARLPRQAGPTLSGSHEKYQEEKA